MVEVYMQSNWQMWLKLCRNSCDKTCVACGCSIRNINRDGQHHNQQWTKQFNFRIILYYTNATLFVWNGLYILFLILLAIKSAFLHSFHPYFAFNFLDEYLQYWIRDGFFSRTRYQIHLHLSHAVKKVYILAPIQTFNHLHRSYIVVY